MIHFMEFDFFDRVSDNFFDFAYPPSGPLVVLSYDLWLFCKQERMFNERMTDCAKNPYQRPGENKAYLFSPAETQDKINLF